MDYRHKLISDTMASLYSSLDSVALQIVNDKLTIALSDYEIIPRCTTLQVIDTESGMLLKKFLATKRLEGRSEKTINRYRYIIQRFSDTTNIPFKDVDVYALRLYLATLTQNGCNDNTVNGIRSIFCSFFGWLHDEQFIETNPTANLSAVKCRKEIRKPYSNVELELIKSGCKSLRDRALVEFLLSTGCRVTETCNLNISDVNFDTNECKVLGKGNKERVVFLSDVCAMHLKKYLASRNDTIESLFIGKGTERLSPQGVRRMLKQLEAKTGVENVHPHRFRRTLATNLIQKGMAIQDVATILGHSNVNTTMTYVYIDTDNVKAKYNRLAS